MVAGQHRAEELSLKLHGKPLQVGEEPLTEASYPSKAEPLLDTTATILATTQTE